jgi:hypothetical protein
MCGSALMTVLMLVKLMIMVQRTGDKLMKIHRGVKLLFTNLTEDTLAGDAMGRLRDGDDIDKANRWDHILKHQFQNGYEIEISAEEAKR